MAKEFRLPDIGEGLTEAEIIRWLIPEGGAVKADQPVVEVETDKAVVEIPSPFGGVVLHHGGKQGQTLAVGDILVVIGEPGEVWPVPTDSPLTKPEVVDKVDEHVATDEGMPEPGRVPPQAIVEPPPPATASPTSAQPEASGAARPIVGSLSEEAFALAPRTDRVASALARTQALPLVRKLAKDLGVNLDEVTGTGPDGRIVREDVIAAADAISARAGGGPVVEPLPVTLPPMPVAREGERRPMSKLRKTIASNMSKSWSEIPHVTTFDEVDASRLLTVRRAFESRHKTKVPFEALLIKAVLPALAAHPEFNARIDGDDLMVFGHYDIGLAVDTPDGLIVAVVKAADQRTLLELSAEVRRLAEGAKVRKLNATELSGQTFTISNIGALGGGYGTPLVPPGTTAILSVGKAVERPVAADGKVVVAPLLPLSLSYDHRVIDGGIGRRFMAMVIENLAEPALFLA